MADEVIVFNRIITDTMTTLVKLKVIVIDNVISNSDKKFPMLNCHFAARRARILASKRAKFQYPSLEKKSLISLALVDQLCPSELGAFLRE